jgi:hypothetical protein
MVNVKENLRDIVGRITQPLHSDNHYWQLGHRINSSYIILRRFIYRNL